MRNNEGKLAYFALDIMADVEVERREIIEDIEEELEKDYAQKEMMYLNDAYELIQATLNKIDQERIQLISKVTMEKRVKLLAKRNSYIQQMYNEAEEALVAFTKTDAYIPYLLDLIEQGKKELGEGEIVIYLGKPDESIGKVIKEKTGLEVIIESKKINLIGGCRLKNINQQIVMDASFARKLEEEREAFIHKCQLSIE